VVEGKTKGDSKTNKLATIGSKEKLPMLALSSKTTMMINGKHHKARSRKVVGKSIRDRHPLPKPKTNNQINL
jgi:hypothetical protein